MTQPGAIGTARGPLHFVAHEPPGPGRDVVLFLAPAPQTLDAVERALRPWLAEILADGLWVLAPLAPVEGLLTCSSSHARVPALLDHFGLAQCHLVGVADGGRSALAIAAAYPERFESVLALPGAAPAHDGLESLTALPVTVAVGSEDAGWLSASRSLCCWLVRAGGEARLVVLEGRGSHAYRGLPWSRVRDWIPRTPTDSTHP